MGDLAKVEKMKKGVNVLAVLLTVFMVAVAGSSFYMLRYSLQPENRGKDIAGSYHYLYANYPYLEQWVDSLNREGALKDTFVSNPQGVRLHAYYIAAPQPTANSAVIVHGYTDNAIRMLMIGYLYNHDLGYNILLPDLQDHGLSGGKTIGMGWKDRLDVLEWMEVANELFGDSTRMVVHGISMGAATTMMLSGEPQQPYVRCFIEDCGYTSVWDEFSHELKERFNLTPFPLMYTTSALCKLLYGWSFKEASSLEQVRKCDYPMFFIHGEEDDFVPTWMVFPLYDAKTSPKEIWTLPGVGHATAFKLYPESYREKVAAFLERYMN